MIFLRSYRLCLKISQTLCITIGWQLQKTVHLWKCNIYILRISTRSLSSHNLGSAKICMHMVYKAMLKEPTILDLYYYMNARNCQWRQLKTDTGSGTFWHYHNSNFNVHTVGFICAMSLTLPAVEAERVNPRTLCSDSSSATGVGLFLGGVVAGALGVLLIVGIVGGACWLRRSKHKWVN